MGLQMQMTGAGAGAAGQMSLAAAASFIGTWIVMTAAMMLPSLVPMLWRYRRAVGEASGARLAWLTAVVALAYFFVWTVIGVVAYPLTVALSGAGPIVIGVVVVIAGALQLSSWKARHLARCREAPGRGHVLPAVSRMAWRHGMRLGIDCGYSCSGWMAMLLALGVMDLRAMAVVTAAITVERVVPGGESAARGTLLVALAAGVITLAQV